MTEKPVYPIRVVFDDGDVWRLDNRVEAESSLEWFDTDDPEHGAIIVDANDRRVRLKVVAHRLEVFELYP